MRLTPFRFPAGTCIAQAQPQPLPQVELSSPATAVMTDLTQVRAATIGPTDTLTAARQTMIHQGVRLLFVVREMPCVEGLISAADLEGERPLRVIAQRGVRFGDLTVADVMTPLAEFDAVDFADLSISTVAEAIEALKRVGRRHLLVAERAGSGHGPRIRGIISHTQIERQLGRPIDAMERADTFSEIRAALAQ